MPQLAHIGGIPIEEWLPFLVPVLAVYVYVRRSERRRRAEVQRVLDAGGDLSDGVIATILDEWSASGHDELRAKHARLMAPPGPNGAMPHELAQRAQLEEHEVRSLLDDLSELGCLEEDARDGAGEARVWLTAWCWPRSRASATVRGCRVPADDL
jgi:hypothetical protein